MRHLPALASLCLLTAALVLPADVIAQPDARPGPRGQGPGPRGQGPVVTVSGEGQAKAAPDTATVTLGATAQAEEAADAQQQVNEIMQRAIEAVKEQGIEEQNIQTAGLSLHPVYSNQRPPRPMEGGEGGDDEPRIVGYRATNTLSIEVSDLGKIGDVIDAAIEAGANELQGVEFSLRNDLEARSEALRRATRIARAKAQVLAEAVGQPLGQLVEIRESGVNVRPPQPFYAGARMATMEAAATPVQPGQMTITAEVVLVYRLAGDQNRPTTRPGQ